MATDTSRYKGLVSDMVNEFLLLIWGNLKCIFIFEFAKTKGSCQVEKNQKIREKLGLARSHPLTPPVGIEIGLGLPALIQCCISVVHVPKHHRDIVMSCPEH